MISSSPKRQRLSLLPRVLNVVASPWLRPTRPVHRSVLERLEDRQLLSGTLVSTVLAGNTNTGVTGTVYADMDKNGIRNNGENGIAGWTVYIDLDQSGTLNADSAGTLEPSAITNKDGDYTISRLIPGTYRVAEVIAPGWTATAPVSVDTAVVNNSKKTVNFFNFAGGNVQGTLWNDVNQDGIRATDGIGGFAEPSLPGWTVFLDVNKDGAPSAGEPSTITKADGTYQFSDIPEGDYEVTVVLPGAWEPTKGHDIKQTAAVTRLATYTQDFAFFSLTDGAITGTVWSDLNGDGDRATDPTTGEFTEPGLEGWTVFIDENLNGLADDTEPTAITDADGNYTFASLAEGTYVVQEVLPDGWTSAPGFADAQNVDVFVGETTNGVDFANFTVLNGSIRGTMWNDVNRNGLRDASLAGDFTEPGLSGWTVYLDLNRNAQLDVEEPTAITDTTGGYNFADLQVGDYEIREIVPAGWEPTVGFSDSYGVRVYSGTETVAHDLANFSVSTTAPGTLTGVVWNDQNGNGVRDTASDTGAFTDPGLSGWTVFVDANSNGALDTGEAQATSGTDGSYTITNVSPGTVRVVVLNQSGWRSTSPATGVRMATLRNAGSVSALDFGQETLKNSTIRGNVYADRDKNGARGTGDKGLAGLQVYLDLNHNGAADAGEPTATTSADLYYTPLVDESGDYSFAHLAPGSYDIRVTVPDALSATPADQRARTIVMAATEDHPGVDFAAQYRATEVRGVKFDDANGNHTRDAGEAPVTGSIIYVDLDRDDVMDAGEPSTITGTDGSYTFTGLEPGSYVVREAVPSDHKATYPNTKGGIMWPAGVSNPASGDVSPTSITASLAKGQSLRQNCTIRLPGTGALTNKVDVFLLFDDTGSFVNNSPIVRSAFPTIISQLQAALPGIDLGFGVGRFEEYANFASEYATGRPFILNQPIVATSTPGYMNAIQAGLNRTTPGYGGDQPETDIEALYQLVTGKGFDGNNNGSVLDSGAAGLGSTQLNPGASGDVPSFASFKPDAAAGVLPGDGTIGGGGFRAGALPIVLVATDTGFAFQPKGESTISGVGGVSLPVTSFTQTSRPSTPYNYGAGIQETITGLNALGALVIGLGTNPQSTIDPRQGLESLSSLTGAINRSTVTIDNGTADPIAPGDPLYFQIASGFAGSVANGVVNAIQNAVTSVAVDVTLQASDPNVKIINHSGVQKSIGSGQAATFDVEIIGDGTPRRFDLQFVRAGTNVVLGSIPVVVGTPVTGDCYDFTELEDGEIEVEVDFGSVTSISDPVISTPTINLSGTTFAYDAKAHGLVATATGTDGLIVPGTFSYTYNGTATSPTAAGTYAVTANFVSSSPAYRNATASATLTISQATPAVNVAGGSFAFDGLSHVATATATGIDGVAVSGSFSFTYNGAASAPTTAGTYSVVASFTSADSNYGNATGTATLTIGQSTATVTINDAVETYDGLSHQLLAAATGLDGKPLAGSFSYTYNGGSALPTAAGVYTVVANFHSDDANYADAIGAAKLTINPAASTLVVIGGTSTFDGLSHAATAVASGLGGVVVPGAFSFTYNGSTTAPANAGVYSVIATFESSDPNYIGGTSVAILTIDPATPAVVVSGGVFIYDGAAHSASAAATGIGGVAVPGSFTYLYNGSSVLPTNAGTYNVIANFTSSDTNYRSSIAGGVIEIGAATPVFTALSSATIDAGTPTFVLTGKLSAGTLAPAGDQVIVTLNGIAQTAIVSADGSFAATFATASLPAGSYIYTAKHVSSGSNFNAAVDGSATLTVRAVPSEISATGININAIAGAPASRTVATINSATADAASYLATIDWGDGTSSVGQVVGTGSSLSVNGVHTYATAGSNTVRVTISLKGSTIAPAVTTSVAKVTSLSLAAGKTREPDWWATTGQQLIKSFNGSAGSTSLGNWLAETMPNLFGASAGATNMKGRTNTEVAAYFMALWKRLSDDVATEVLATALNVYATTDLLGGTQGVRFGFTSTATGFGARSYNVGKNGAAVGVAKGATVNVYQMLRGVDQLSRNGSFYAGDKTLLKQGQKLFSDLNSI